MDNYTLDQLVHYLSNIPHTVKGKSLGKSVSRLAIPEDADETSLIWISPTKNDKEAIIASSKAMVVICDPSVKTDLFPEKCFIVSNDPKLAFTKIGNSLFVRSTQYGIHPTAVIHPDAKIAKNVHIGPFTYVGKCEIKENTIVHGHCYLYDNVIIDEQVVINAGCVIGADGLGDIRDQNGTYIPFPHIGRVIIETGVKIGPNSCVAKGALRDTIIRKNSVIDSFVQVGHNVLIEENVLVLSNGVIGGSSIIKKNAVLAIGAHICDYVTIGENAHIGPGVVIMKDVLDNTKVVPKLSLTLPKIEIEKN